MSQLGPVTSLKFITHNFFYQGEREGDGEGTGQAAQGPVGHIGDLGSCLQGGGTQEGCGQRRGPDSCSRVPSGGCAAEDRLGGVGAIFHLVQDGG